MQAANTPVAGIGPALHKPARFQPVDQPRNGDGLHFDQPGQFVLRQARLDFQPGQNDPLRAGHAHTPRPLIGAGPYQPGDVVDEEQRFLFKIMGHDTTKSPDSC
jgi:hypothetical protein